MFSTDKPHNPLINAGAIVVSSLLKKDLNVADRFDYVSLTILSFVLLIQKHISCP